MEQTQETVKRDPLQVLTDLLNIANKKGAFDLDQIAAGIASINAIASYVNEISKPAPPQGEGIMPAVTPAPSRKKKRKR